MKQLLTKLLFAFAVTIPFISSNAAACRLFDARFQSQRRSTDYIQISTPTFHKTFINHPFILDGLRAIEVGAAHFPWLQFIYNEHLALAHSNPAIHLHPALLNERLSAQIDAVPLDSDPIIKYAGAFDLRMVLDPEKVDENDESRMARISSNEFFSHIHETMRNLGTDFRTVDPSDNKTPSHVTYEAENGTAVLGMRDYGKTENNQIALVHELDHLEFFFFSAEQISHHLTVSLQDGFHIAARNSITATLGRHIEARATLRELYFSMGLYAGRVSVADVASEFIQKITYSFVAADRYSRKMTDRIDILLRDPLDPEVRAELESLLYFLRADMQTNIELFQDFVSRTMKQEKFRSVASVFVKLFEDMKTSYEADEIIDAVLPLLEVHTENEE